MGLNYSIDILEEQTTGIPTNLLLPTALDLLLPNPTPEPSIS